MQFDGCAHLVERFAAHAEEHGDGVATLFKAQAAGGVDVEFDVLRGGAGCTAVLECGHARAVLSRVGVDAVGVEGLSEHEDGFSMRTRIAGGIGKIHVGGEGNVARDFLPDKMESVGGRPEIRACCSDGVDLVLRVVGESSGGCHAAYVRLASKDTERAGR